MDLVLRVISGPHTGLTQTFRDANKVLVGRSRTVPVALSEDRLLSREHFQIEIDPPVCSLKDLGSKNGTRVNGLRVEKSLLRDGDVITVGQTGIEVIVVADQKEGLTGLQCPGCGKSAPPNLPEGDMFGHWLCPDCVVRRISFPRTHRDYLIEKSLGRGGMGEVFLAHQLSTNKPVAIKMMVPTSNAPEKAKEYFRREMMVLKDLLMSGGQCHPNVVAFYEMFEIEGQFQLVMEYVPGKNALEWMSNFKEATPTTSVVRIARLLLSGLEYSHGKGYVHRDIKPSNLLIHGPVERPKVKLSDIGLAKSYRDNSGFVALTTLGDTGGSLGFISPDHIHEFRDLKASADVYSVGATLYYMLTRDYPFMNFDPYRRDSYEKILEDPPIPLRARRPDAPEGLERVIAKALAKKPRDRWKSAKEMNNALRPFSDEPY